MHRTLKVSISEYSREITHRTLIQPMMNKVYSFLYIVHHQTARVTYVKKADWLEKWMCFVVSIDNYIKASKHITQTPIAWKISYRFHIIKKPIDTSSLCCCCFFFIKQIEFLFLCLKIWYRMEFSGCLRPHNNFKGKKPEIKLFT